MSVPAAKHAAPGFNEELEMQCIHCDHFFDEGYLRWHFSHRKPADRCAGQSVLRCGDCGLMTPVRWQFAEPNIKNEREP